LVAHRRIPLKTDPLTEIFCYISRFVCSGDFIADFYVLRLYYSLRFFAPPAKPLYLISFRLASPFVHWAFAARVERKCLIFVPKVFCIFVTFPWLLVFC